MKHEGWHHTASTLGIALSPDKTAALERYEALLGTRGAALGLVSASDLTRLRERHVVDALRGVPCLPPAGRTVIDLGSGGGIPGVPVAIARPDLEVVLAEGRRNRAAFLELVIDDLRLTGVSVHASRVEDLEGPFDVCLARAFAPPAATWAAARRLLVPGGSLLYWAGEGFDPERDVPPDVQVRVPGPDPLAYGGPVVIMSAR